MERKINYLCFAEIQSCFGYIDKSCFRAYLTEIYSNLKTRDESERLPGVSLCNFRQFICYDYFFSKRIFDVISSSPKFITEEEFVEGLVDLYCGNFHCSAELIFKLFDSSNSKQISKEQVELIFLYLPNEKRASLNELLHSFYEIINKLFGENECLSLGDFIMNTQNSSSSVFIEIFCFLQLGRPFDSGSLPFYASSKHFEEDSFSGSSMDDSRIILPRLCDRLEFSNFILCTIDYRQIPEPEEEPEPSVSLQERPFDSHFISERDSSEESSGEEVFVGRESVKKIKNSLKSKRIFDNKFGKVSLVISDTMKTPEFECSGFIFKYDNVRDNKFRNFLILSQNDLILFSDEPSKEQNGFEWVVNIRGSTLKRVGEINLGRLSYFKFVLKVNNRFLEFYCDSLKDYEKWVKSLETVLGKNNLEEIYEITKVLGKRRSVEFFSGISKFTGDKVIIKIYNKKQANSQFYSRLIKENYFMTHLNHPAIVKLLDFYETESEFIQVLEFAEGSKLEDLKLNVNKYIIDFEKLIILAKKITSLLEYLRYFKVVNSSLSLSSVIIQKQSKGSFFLADIPIKVLTWKSAEIVLDEPIVSTEVDSEIKYLAPEILQNDKVYLSSDFWSFGVIIYNLISGKFPFFDGLKKEKAVLYDEELLKPIAYPGNTFSNLNERFVEFLQHLLIYNPFNRELGFDLFDKKLL